MKSNNCQTECSVALVLLALVVVLLCLKYYYTFRTIPEVERFESPSSSLEHPHKKQKYFNPCSPDNFKKILYDFYKSAEKYRNIEKDLNAARTEYEEKYKEFRDQQHVLDKHKHTLNNCIKKT